MVVTKVFQIKNSNKLKQDEKIGDRSTDVR